MNSINFYKDILFGFGNAII